jgi:RNase P/RNase MRP subunit p29
MKCLSQRENALKPCVGVRSKRIFVTRAKHYAKKCLAAYCADILATSIFMLLFAAAGFGDEIHLQGGNIIKGKVIQVTEKDVEYRLGKDRVFDVVNKSAVVKIIYDDGRSLYFRLDTLFRRDGTAVRGTIVSVTKDDILYNPEGSADQKTMKRVEVDRIEYSDGKIVYIADRPGAREEIKFEEKKQTGGFHDSFVRIAGFFGFGNSTGGIFEKERRVLNAYKPDLFQAYIVPRDYHSSNSFMAGGGEIDVMAPAVKFVQRRRFDLTGIKFGIKGRYGYESIDTVITDEGSYYNSIDSYELFRGRNTSNHYWAAGPVMNLILSPKNNLINLLINFYVTAGQVIGGRLYPAAALRSSHFLGARLAGMFTGQYLPPISALYASRYINKTKFNGYTIRGGFGPHFSLNRFCPITVGLNVTYAYSSLHLGRAPFIYLDGNKKANRHQVGLEISTGFHF